MAKKNFYAVKNGIKPGIYNSWKECKPQVDGFKGAVYKGFNTKREAEAYLSGDSAALNEAGEPKAEVAIYVDGSFDEQFGVYGYGYVALFKDGNVEKYYGAGNNRDTARLRNVAGEMLAAMNAVRYAINNNFKSVLICYDYAGIELWATGGWKAKNELTSRYAKAMKEWSDSIEIRFQKIAAHTGVEYNEVADQLAKFAIDKFKERQGIDDGSKKNH